MSTRINFFLRRNNPPSQGQQLLSQLTSSIGNCFILVIVIAAGLIAPQKTAREPPLKRWADEPFFAHIRIESLARKGQDAEIDELRENFLINEKIQDQLLREEFEQSGLAHLLAISGGQTAPAAATISLLILLLTVACMRSLKLQNAFKWLMGLRFASGLLHTLVIFFLVGLYQSSGALTRALANHLTLCARSLLLLSCDGRHKSTGKTRALLLASPWCLGWLLLHNPVRDLSFLLSALGALTSVFVSQLLALLIRIDHTRTMPKPDNSPLPARFISTPAFLNISLSIVSVSLTSALMSLLTIPFWPAGNIFEKVLANIIAGPCVMFIITPAALGICLSVVLDAAGLGLACQQMLQWGLEILLYTARTFANPVEHGSYRRTADSFFVNGLSPSVVIALEVLILSALTEFLRARLTESANLTVPTKGRRVSAFMNAKTHTLRFFDKIR